MSSTINTAAATEITLVACSCFGGECVVRITEDGYEIVSDTRKVKDVWLHLMDDAPAAITNKLRDSMLRYYYTHPVGGTPGIGATPQRYFSGLTITEREAIGRSEALR